MLWLVWEGYPAPCRCRFIHTYIHQTSSHSLRLTWYVLGPDLSRGFFKGVLKTCMTSFCNSWHESVASRQQHKRKTGGAVLLQMHVADWCRKTPRSMFLNCTVALEIGCFMTVLRVDMDARALMKVCPSAPRVSQLGACSSASRISAASLHVSPDFITAVISCKMEQPAWNTR